jgi:uracil-DNA glycosylase
MPRSGVDPRRCQNEKCTLWKPGIKPVWDFYDPAQCEILFIAEAPGEDEDFKGRPLVGQAGGVFFQALHHANLTTIGMPYQSYIYTNGLNLDPLAKVGIANVCHCRPAGNRTPSSSEASACASYLAETISSCNNLRAIVTLGDTPLHHLLGELHITKRRGMPCLWQNIPCVPTVHPALCLPYRSPESFDLLVHDFIKAVRLSKDGWSEPEVIVDDINESYVEELLSTGFAFDIESTTLIACKGVIIGCAFSNKKGWACHAWRDNPYQWELATRLLESNAFKIAQGNSFDVPYLYQRG